MERTRNARLPLAMAVGFAALTLLAVATPQAGAAEIVMKGKTEKGLKFAGDTDVERGDKLKIVNETSPKKVGPHTFTLVEKKLIPTSNKEGKACYGDNGVCQGIFKAHDVNEEEETVGKLKVEEGKKGWDTEFGKKGAGDSWFTFDEGGKTKREVTAKAGSKLSYFCVIHPWMTGKLKVE